MSNSAEDEILQHFTDWDKKKYKPKAGEPALPPQLSEFTNKLADEVIKELNRLPFFMTELDETDGEGGENTQIEALKSLAYDGTPIEIATNFKNQGNDCFKAKQYKNAVTYYTKGLDVEIEDDTLKSSLFLNRAACNLELKNYRRCIEDCKNVLVIDPKSVKACYRSGRAFFAINKFEEALGILNYGLTLDPENQPMKDTVDKVLKKIEADKIAKEKKEREAREKEMKQSILANAIKLRHIDIITTTRPAEMLDDTNIRLEDPLDYQLQLIFPATVVYPTLDEFDFVAEISELTTPLELIETVLNRPKEWFEQDQKHKHFANFKLLECYMETVSGGLAKVGRKIAINEALMADKPEVPLFDNSLRIYVVPKSEVPSWIETWSKDAALGKRKGI